MELLGKISIEIPEGFAIEESKVVYQTPQTEELYDPQLALLGKKLSKQKAQTEVISNLIVKRREADPQTNLPYVAMDLAAKQLHNMGTAVRDLQTQPFVFQDNIEGVLVSFSFPANQFQLRQYHAFRLDGSTITHATWTCDHLATTDQKRDEILGSLGQIIPTQIP